MYKVSAIYGWHQFNVINFPESLTLSIGVFSNERKIPRVHYFTCTLMIYCIPEILYNIFLGSDILIHTTFVPF